jgi:two-component system OmpR family sensor kinase
VTQSLRRTLAVRFAATMAVGLSVVSVATWYAASAVLRHDLDQSIAAAAFLIVNETSISSTCPGAGPSSVQAAWRFDQDINRYVVIRDPHCVVLRAIPGWAMDLPADTAAVARARAGQLAFSEADWHDKPMRSAYRAVHVDGTATPGDLVVQVAASLQPLYARQRDVLLVMLAIIAVGTGAAYFGARRLADSAVRPVLEITEQATHIEAGTLGQQISAHADVSEYQGLVGVLNRMLDRLSRAFNGQRRFTSDVSHELRSPLTAVRGEIEVALRADRSPREYQRVLHSVLEEIDRMSTMAEELLLITRADVGLIQAQREPTDVGGLVTASLARLRDRIEEKGLRVELPAGGSNGSIPWIDRLLVGRLVDELLDNAVRFSDYEGRIIVRTETLPGRVRLVVEDTGPGIQPEDLPHIFDPYYRADQARTRGTSTGLGLTTAAAIARLHGGTIHALNRPEGGARFEVDLPISAS